MSKVTLHATQHEPHPNSHHTSLVGQHSSPSQKHNLVTVLTSFLFPAGL